MKVIFLDFDGVLNSIGSFLYEDNRRKKHKEQGVKGPVNQTLCNVCTALFQFVLDKYPDAKVVISSTWRELFNLKWLQEKLKEYHVDGDRVIDCTPVDRMGGDRGREIKWWLDKHTEVTHYVIIDDNDWGITSFHLKERFVQTAWETGMTANHMEELCQKLSKENAVRCSELDEKRKAEEAAELEKIKLENSKQEPDNDF